MLQTYIVKTIVFIILVILSINILAANSYTTVYINSIGNYRDNGQQYNIRNIILSFRLLLSSGITKGYLDESSSFLEDAKLSEPDYFRFTKTVFFSKLVQLLDLYDKDHYTLDLYNYMLSHPPQNSDLDEDVKKFFENSRAWDALILYGHNTRVNNVDYFVYLFCDKDTYTTGKSRNVPLSWLVHMCVIPPRVYSINANSVREIYNNRPWYQLPSLIIFPGCNSGRYDGEGSWRWTFRLSTDDTYYDWWTRAFIGGYTEPKADARAAAWDDLIYIMLKEIFEGANYDFWTLFKNTINYLNSQGYRIGYYADVQYYTPGDGFERQHYEKIVPGAPIIAYYGDHDVEIDPTFADYLISKSKTIVRKYLGSQLYDIVEDDIVDIEVGTTKSMVAGGYQPYSVYIKLNGDIFRYGNGIWVYLWARNDTVFPWGIDIALGVPKDSPISRYIATYIPDKADEIINNIIRESEKYGLHFTEKYTNIDIKKELKFYARGFAVTYDDTVLLIDPIFITAPWNTFYIDAYSINSDKTYISVSIYTTYEDILEYLKKGNPYPQFSVSENYAYNTLTKYVNNQTYTSLGKAYLLINNVLRPVYYVTFNRCITKPDLFNNNVTECYEDAILMFGDTGEISYLNYFTPLWGNGYLSAPGKSSVLQTNSTSNGINSTALNNTKPGLLVNNSGSTNATGSRDIGGSKAGGGEDEAVGVDSLGGNTWLILLVPVVSLAIGVLFIRRRR